MSAPYTKEIDLDHTEGFEFALSVSCSVVVFGDQEYDVTFEILGDKGEKIQLSQLDPRDQLKVRAAAWDIPIYALDFASQEQQNRKQPQYDKYAGF
jgi:hypothetical protein